MNLVAPVAAAASARFFVPSRRSRFVPASHSSYLRGLRGWLRSVSSLTTTSGCAVSTARRTASASKASAIAASAPSAVSASAFERVMPTTEWPPSISCRTSGRPIAPLAPAMKTFIGCLLRLRFLGLNAPGEARQRREDQGEQRQREEVEPAGQVTRRIADVDQVVDRVDRVLERREHQHRRAPAATAHRDVEEDAERDVEGRDVLDVVGVLRGELAQRVVERSRCEEHERAQQQVVHRRDHQNCAQARLVHRTTRLTSLPGTTIVLTIAWPFTCAWTFGDSCAIRSSSSFGVSGATVRRSRTLPLTCTTISIDSPTASAGSACGQGSSQRRLPVSRS